MPPGRQGGLIQARYHQCQGESRNVPVNHRTRRIASDAFPAQAVGGPRWCRQEREGHANHFFVARCARQQAPVLEVQGNRADIFEVKVVQLLEVGEIQCGDDDAGKAPIAALDAATHMHRPFAAHSVHQRPTNEYVLFGVCAVELEIAPIRHHHLGNREIGRGVYHLALGVDQKQRAYVRHTLDARLEHGMDQKVAGRKLALSQVADPVRDAADYKIDALQCPRRLVADDLADAGRFLNRMSEFTAPQVDQIDLGRDQQHQDSHRAEQQHGTHRALHPVSCLSPFPLCAATRRRRLRLLKRPNSTERQLAETDHGSITSRICTAAVSSASNGSSTTMP